MSSLNRKFLLQQVSLWNLFLLDISSSTASDCKAEDVRKHRHSDQSSWQENRSRIVKCWGGMMHKRLHCSADSVTVELQTSSITNISTQTVHWELCVMRFHGWAAAVVTQDFRPSFLLFSYNMTSYRLIKLPVPQLAYRVPSEFEVMVFSTWMDLMWI